MARPHGSKNKISAQTREAFQLLVDSKLSSLSGWLDEVAKTDPAKAFSLVLDLTHYVLPKLKAVELREPDENPLFCVRFSDGTGELFQQGSSERVRFIDPPARSNNPEQIDA